MPLMHLGALTDMMWSRGGAKAAHANQTGKGAIGKRDDMGRADGVQVMITVKVPVEGKKKKRSAGLKVVSFKGTITSQADGDWVAKANVCEDHGDCKGDCKGCDECTWRLSDTDESWCVHMSLRVHVRICKHTRFVCASRVLLHVLCVLFVLLHVRATL